MDVSPHESLQPYEPPPLATGGDAGEEAPQGAGAGRMLRAFWRNRLVIAGCAVLGLGLGVGALRVLPANYKSGVSILLDPKRADSLGAHEDFASIAVDSGKVADVEQILISSRLLEKVVRADHMADDPQFGGLSVSLPRRLLDALTGTRAPLADGPEIRTERAIERLGRMVRTARVGLTYVITVTVTAPTARAAQHLATAIADAYIADQVATKYAEAHDDGAWLHARLEQIRPELVASEARIQSIRHQYGLFQTDNAPGSSMNRQRLAELTSELVKAQAEAAQDGARYDQAMATIRAGGLPDVGGSMMLDTLRTSTVDAERKLADLSEVYGPQHPVRVQAASSLATLNARVRTETLRLTRALRDQYAAARVRVRSVQALVTQIAGDEAAADNVHGRALLNEAERVAQVDRTIYEATLNRLHDVEQQETRQRAEAGIISPAPFPEQQNFPRAMLCLPAGGVFGLCMGLGFTLMSTLLRGRLEDADQAESRLQLPVLGAIPLLGRRELGRGRDASSVLSYLASSTATPYADSLRRLRLAIRSRAGEGARVVQITSSEPGEGKSTLAISLSLTAARSGVRTALVDFDLHHPSVRLMLAGVGIGAGEIVARSGTFATAVSRHPDLPLCIVTAGLRGEGSDPSMQGAGLQVLLAELRTQFDLVIVDTAPVLASSDALLAAQAVDATVLVCAVQSTSYEQALRAIRALRMAGGQVCGLVLNKVAHAPASYGYPYQPRRLSLWHRAMADVA